MSVGLEAHFYGLRWLMLLVAQEFSIHNVIKIWDTLLADHDRFTFLNFICIAMVIYRREALLKNEFGECLEMLQK